jgi:hypothetical protein
VPCYLFGTFHLPDERVTDLHPDVPAGRSDAARHRARRDGAACAPAPRHA